MENIPVKLYDHENCDDKVWYGHELLVSRNVRDNAELPKLVNCQQYGLIMLTEGEAEYTINLNKVVLRAPVLWIATPHTVWEYHHGDNSSAVKGCLVVASENLIQQLPVILTHALRTAVRKKPFFELSEDEKQTFLSYSDLIYRLAHLPQNFKNDRLIYSVLESLVHYFIHLLEEKDCEIFSQKKHSRGEYISEEFIRLAQIHATKHHTMDFYANQLHVSESSLSYIVKQVTQKPPRKWIDEILLKEAIYMLYDQNKSMIQIADALGFSSPRLLGTFFRRKTGKSPTQYREMLG